MSKQSDLGPKSIIGFQSEPRTASRPYTRDNRRADAVDGGEFQTAVKRDDERLPISKPIATDGESLVS